MRKSKIFVDRELVNKVSHSAILDDNSKITFLRYIGYLKKDEKKELISLL